MRDYLMDRYRHISENKLIFLFSVSEEAPVLHTSARLHIAAVPVSTLQDVVTWPC